MSDKNRLMVMELAAEANNWGWLPFHETWGSLQHKNSRNIFSNAAKASKTLEISLRPQEISFGNAICWGEKLLLISAIDRLTSRHLIKLTAVDIPAVTVSRTVKTYGKNEKNHPVVTGTEIKVFPAWLTEKYVKYEQPNPFALIDVCYVLIVPKAVEELDVGDVVSFDDADYAVEVCHLLDPDRNEYEVVYRRDA